MTAAFIAVAGYDLAADRAYDPDTHVWVETQTDGLVRLGLDPLGLETMGTLAQIDLLAPGTRVERGAPLGTLEAEKFVGPLESPLTGTVRAVNGDAIGDPRLVQRAPFDTWLIELDATDFATESAALVSGDDIEPWFAAKVTEYRVKGVLAE